MSFLSEFREFAVKGNVVDMAVGIIIGAAFGKIVTSLVEDVIMPPIGMVIGNMNFENLAMTLKPATEGSPAVLIKYGQFIQVSINFVIVAFAVFMLVKMVNRLKRGDGTSFLDAAKPKPTPQEVLLTEIRDLLKNK